MQGWERGCVKGYPTLCFFQELGWALDLRTSLLDKLMKSSWLSWNGRFPSVGADFTEGGREVTRVFGGLDSCGEVDFAAGHFAVVLPE